MALRAIAISGILLFLGGCADVLSDRISTCAMKETAAQGLPPYHLTGDDAAACEKGRDNSSR